MRREAVKHALKSESARSLHAMVELARSEPEIRVDVAKFDGQPHLLNVQNGTIDLRAGELLPHSREDMLTKIVPVSYDPQAKCPQWHTF